MQHTRTRVRMQLNTHVRTHAHTHIHTHICTHTHTHTNTHTHTHTHTCTQVVIDAGDSLWQRKDADGILALTRLVEAGFLRLAESDASLCAAKLPRAFHALTPQVRVCMLFTCVCVGFCVCMCVFKRAFS
jgi:hypothetical protein